MSVPSLTLEFSIYIVCVFVFVFLVFVYLIGKSCFCSVRPCSLINTGHWLVNNLIAQSPNYHHQGTFSVQKEMTVVCSRQTSITIRTGKNIRLHLTFKKEETRFLTKTNADIKMTKYELGWLIWLRKKGKLSIFGDSALWRRSSKKLEAQTWFQKFC